MSYIKTFKTKEEYEAFRNSDDWKVPSIYAIENSPTAIIQKVANQTAMVGDIVYYANGLIKTINNTLWSSFLGTPIGVVVIPEGMLPDGKARMISLYDVDSNGNAVTSATNMVWGVYDTDTSLTNYNMVPTTDNAGSTSTGTNNYGCLPSDKFTGVQSFVDSKAKYKASSNLIPSPYLGDDKTLNPEYNVIYTSAVFVNALSDFNGLSNTETLVGLGTDYVAANAAWKYSDGVSNTQWYLPAMGELGFLMPRFNEINAAITAAGGTAVSSSRNYWSSSESSSSNAYGLYADDGGVYDDYDKANYLFVRPLAVV